MRDRPLRVGIIGAHISEDRPGGSWAIRSHVPALRALDGFEFFAVCTTNPVTANRVAEAYSVKHAFSDADELVQHPDVDVVAVCVRVPEHYALVMKAIEAGKHVYCEWPLAQSTSEAAQLTAAARRANVRHMIGLQGRRSPAIEYVRDLIRSGELGQVRACMLNHSVPWVQDASDRGAYLQQLSSGANFLTIPAGHSLDTLCHVLGGVQKLTAIGRIQRPLLEDPSSGKSLYRTAPDQIALLATLETGVLATLRFQGVSRHGSGVLLEINADEGDLVIKPADPATGMIQLSDLEVWRTTSQGRLEPMPVPESYFDVPEEIRSGLALNVARSYAALRSAIEGGRDVAPNFDDAVRLHALLDDVLASSRRFDGYF